MLMAYYSLLIMDFFCVFDELPLDLFNVYRQVYTFSKYVRSINAILFMFSFENSRASIEC